MFLSSSSFWGVLSLKDNYNKESLVLVRGVLTTEFILLIELSSAPRIEDDLTLYYNMALELKEF